LQKPQLEQKAHPISSDRTAVARHRPMAMLQQSTQARSQQAGMLLPPLTAASTFPGEHSYKLPLSPPQRPETTGKGFKLLGLESVAQDRMNPEFVEDFTGFSMLCHLNAVVYPN
jgi:hypothetical protein